MQERGGKREKEDKKETHYAIRTLTRRLSFSHRRSSSTARVTSSVDSPASSRSSCSAVRRSLSSAPRPSTSPASSSARSVRQQYPSYLPAHAIPDLSLVPRTPLGCREATWTEAADLDYSQVPCLPAQDDSVQPHPWWYVTPLSDPHGSAISRWPWGSFTCKDTIHLTPPARSLPLPCPLENLLQDRPRHDPAQDRPRRCRS